MAVLSRHAGGTRDADLARAVGFASTGLLFSAAWLASVHPAFPTDNNVLAWLRGVRPDLNQCQRENWHIDRIAEAIEDERP